MLPEPIQSLAERIAREHVITVAGLLGRSHSATLARARRELWSLVRGSLGYSLPELGRLFDRDHSTILVAIRKREGELRRVNRAVDEVAGRQNLVREPRVEGVETGARGHDATRLTQSGRRGNHVARGDLAP